VGPPSSGGDLGPRLPRADREAGARLLTGGRLQSRASFLEILTFLPPPWGGGTERLRDVLCMLKPVQGQGQAFWVRFVATAEISRSYTKWFHETTRLFANYGNEGGCHAHWASAQLVLAERRYQDCAALIRLGG
jgi:hypothetical protein